jgi:phage-related protein
VWYIFEMVWYIFEMVWYIFEMVWYIFEMVWYIFEMVWYIFTDVIHNVQLNPNSNDNLCISTYNRVFFNSKYL